MNASTPKNVDASEIRRAEHKISQLRSIETRIAELPVSAGARAAGLAIFAKARGDLETRVALDTGEPAPSVAHAEAALEAARAAHAEAERAVREAKAALEAARAEGGIPSLEHASARASETLNKLTVAVGLLRNVAGVLRGRDSGNGPETTGPVARRRYAWDGRASVFDADTTGPVARRRYAWDAIMQLSGPVLSGRSDSIRRASDQWEIAESIVLSETSDSGELAELFRARRALISHRLVSALASEGKEAEARAAEAVERRAVELFEAEKSKAMAKARAKATAELQPCEH